LNHHGDRLSSAQVSLKRAIREQIQRIDRRGVVPKKALADLQHACDILLKERKLRPNVCIMGAFGCAHGYAG
jgi:hypothetical protein